MNFRSSPLSCHLKYTPLGKPQKRRVVENLSFPYTPTPGGSSLVNSFLSSADFLSRWTKLSTLLDALRRLPPETSVMVTDLTDVFKQLPIHPSQHPHHGILWRGKFFCCKTPSFGGCSTPGMFCNVVDLVLDILESAIPSIFTSNIVDDLPFARFDSSLVSADSIFTSLRELGVEWAQNARRLEDVLSVMGTLLYVCEIVPLRRSYLHAFLAWRRKFPDSPMASRHLTRVVLDEMDEWLRFLRSPEPIKASFALPPRVSDHYFFTDACARALGVVVDGRFAITFNLSQRWAEYAAIPGQIATAEAWAVEVVGAVVEVMGLENVAILVGVDNTNVINGFAKGCASNKFVNNTIRCLTEAMQMRNVVLFLRYVNTEHNPADAVSRGFLDSRLSLFPLPLPPPLGTDGGPPP
ncbi:hypothetical protein JCM1840_007367 [Sporobolomyces johnsonii]